MKKFRDVIPEIRKRKFGSIVACAAGAQAKEDVLKELADQVVSLDTTDAATFSQYFKWVSASVSVGNKSMGTSSGIILPPPPAEVHVVV